MRRKSFEEFNCPVARSLERVGDWWTVLILRNAFYGMKRFDQFSRDLGISPNILASRFRRLVEDGIFERSENGDYLLTDVGRDFLPVLLTLMHWGNEHFSSNGAPVVLVKGKGRRPVLPLLVDADTRSPIEGQDFELIAGPGATPSTVRQLETRGRLPFAGPAASESASESATDTPRRASPPHPPPVRPKAAARARKPTKRGRRPASS